MGLMEDVISNFETKGRLRKPLPFGQGHINETYLLSALSKQNPGYILQKINSKVFRDVPGMMQNIQVVTTHLRGKLSQMPGHDPDRESLQLVPTRDGEYYYTDNNDDPWRMFLFLPGTRTFEQVSSPDMAREAGRAIGLFEEMLSDMEIPLIETLPGFHNIHHRIGEYMSALDRDVFVRGRYIKADLRKAESHFEEMVSYYESLVAGKLPIRVTHNDTKLNNVLFDENGKAVCLIDLDTVMPGYVHFDYGDALRTLAAIAPEDEKDLDKVGFDLGLFRAFTRGYYSQAGSFLSARETELMPFAPRYLTYIIGLRFLTDFLNGDTYYKIQYPEHNLVRARTQLRLVEDMENKYEEMIRTIREAAKK